MELKGSAQAAAQLHQGPGGQSTTLGGEGVMLGLVLVGERRAGGQVAVICARMHMRGGCLCAHVRAVTSIHAGSVFSIVMGFGASECAMCACPALLTALRLLHQRLVGLTWQPGAKGGQLQCVCTCVHERGREHVCVQCTCACLHVWRAWKH